jgi:hypothetical protein
MTSSSEKWWFTDSMKDGSSLRIFDCSSERRWLTVNKWQFIRVMVAHWKYKTMQLKDGGLLRICGCTSERWWLLWEYITVHLRDRGSLRIYESPSKMWWLFGDTKYINVHADFAQWLKKISWGDVGLLICKQSCRIKSRAYAGRSRIIFVAAQ